MNGKKKTKLKLKKSGLKNIKNQLTAIILKDFHKKHTVQVEKRKSHEQRKANKYYY